MGPTEWRTHALLEQLVRYRLRCSARGDALGVLTEHGGEYRCAVPLRGPATHLSGSGPARNHWNHGLTARRYGTTTHNTPSTTSAADAHEQFLNNFNDEDISVAGPVLGGGGGGNHFASVRSTRTSRAGDPKERFRHGALPEADMYSAKPVWQQLNEMESTWKLHFRHKGRVQSQKAISRAKKCVESLDAIEANQSRLVNIDSFRESFWGGASAGRGGSSVAPPDDAVGDERLAGDRGAANLAPVSERNGSIGTPVGPTKGDTKAPSGGKWRLKNLVSRFAGGDTAGNGGGEEPFVNDLHLPGNAYYEKVSLDEKDDSRNVTNEFMEPMEPALPPRDDDAFRASIDPALFADRLLNERERTVVEGIFGNTSGDVIDASTPAAVIEATTNLEPETWLNMNPAHIVLQQAILKCKSSSQLLLAIAGKVDQMNNVNVSTALHRMARQSTSYSRYTLTSNETFAQLVAAVERHLASFDSQGLSNVLWSVVRLRVQPRWMDALLDAVNRHSADLAPSELASCLFAVSKLPVKNSTSIDLRDRLIFLAQEGVGGFKRPLDLTCVATALARLNVRNPVLFGRISSSVIALMDEFNLQQVCGISWAFASLGFTDRLLFARIRQFLEEHANAGSMRDVVHLAWALSKVREANQEVFLCTISPFVRSHIAHLSCRDISTVAWAFVNAEIEDTDLFEDLAAALQHHVEEMTTHDIAAAVAAFSHMTESHRPLFKKMRKRAVLLVNEFTPLQLAKIVRGFAAVADDRFYSQVCRAIESKVHLMLPENIVEVLMGLTDAGHVSPALFKKLLSAVSVGASKMYAEDSLLLLQLATKLRREYPDAGMDPMLHKVSHALVDQIEKRVSRWKCYNLVHITQFFECLSGMGIGGSKGDSAVRTLARQLAPCLNRICGGKVATDVRNEAFANFLRACAQLPPRKLALVQAELSKNTQLMTAMHKSVASLRCGAFLDDAESPISKTEAVHCLVRLGYLDDGVVALCDELISTYDDGHLTAGDSAALDGLSKFIWLLTECNLHVSWVRDKLRELSGGIVAAEPSESMVRILWSCVVLGEDALLMDMVPRFVPLFDRLPEDMFAAQQVALHVLSCLPVQVEGDEAPLHAGPLVAGGDDSYVITREVHDTLREWLDYQRDDLYTVSPGSKRRRALELDYDAAISESLISMKIPHKTVHTVENIYRISVSFPVENHVIDVVNFTDAFVPNGQVRSRALLRQRQLQLLGYGLSSLELPRLYQAARERNCRALIAETISGFNAAALDYVRPSPS